MRASFGMVCFKVEVEGDSRLPTLSFRSGSGRSSKREPSHEMMQSSRVRIPHRTSFPAAGPHCCVLRQVVDVVVLHTGAKDRSVGRRRSRGVATCNHPSGVSPRPVQRGTRVVERLAMVTKTGFSVGAAPD